MWRASERQLLFPYHRIGKEGSMNCTACADVQFKLIQTIQNLWRLIIYIFEQLLQDLLYFTKLSPGT